MIVNDSIINEVKTYVADILKNELSPDITYHSLNHTEEVVKSALEISRELNLDANDIYIIHLAAWFHDIGYTRGCDNHEKSGANMAETFLLNKGVDQSVIDKVKGCIMATQMPQNPQTFLEKVLCDADLMHLAKRDYFKKSELLHNEIQKVKNKEISDDDWLKMNGEFLSKHCFFTDYAKKNYESAVKENLNKVNQQLKSWKK